MLRRSVLEISCRRSFYFRRNATRVTTQIPSYLSSRKQYCSIPGKPPESGSSFPKLIVGGVTLGAAVLTAYYLSQKSEGRGKVLQSVKHGAKDVPELSGTYKDLQEDKNLESQSVVSGIQEPDHNRIDVLSQEKNDSLSDFPDLGDLSKEEGDSQSLVRDEAESTREKSIIPFPEKEVPSPPESSITFIGKSTSSKKSLEEKENLRTAEVESRIEQREGNESTPIHALANAMSEESELISSTSQQLTVKDMPEDALSTSKEQRSSLLDEYDLRNIPDSTTSSDQHKGIEDAKQDSSDVNVSNDGKVVLDLLQAIHAAEKRQAELDVHIFAEEKKRLKEKYDKELKDARARELMYAEEAAILDKELKKERIKAVAAMKSLQDELEQKLKMEIEQKEAEAESKLKKIEELGKAELAAAIASEKASHLEKLAEADVHINALCMAFYTRSEEVRQSHSVHKLALGTLALEDALSKGLPIKKEINALHVYLEGGNKDPLLDLVLSSLPQETWDNGSDTILQLKNEFDALKGSVRHFSLIPPGGGGILAHSLARVASLLKVGESDTSGDGVESLMNKVDSFLAKGKLSEAADTLENGVKGTQAAEVIGDWLKRARNRAITEQALTLLQSYATSIGLA